MLLLHLLGLHMCSGAPHHQVSSCAGVQVCCSEDFLQTESVLCIQNISNLFLAEDDPSFELGLELHLFHTPQCSSLTWPCSKRKI